MSKRKTTVMAGQGLPDIVVQELGTMELAMQVAADNDMALTDTLSPGDVVAIDEELRADNRVTDEMRLKGAASTTWALRLISSYLSVTERSRSAEK